MNKNIIIAIIVLALVGVGGYAFINKNTANSEKIESEKMMKEEGSAVEEQNEGAMMQEKEDSMMEGEAKEFKVSGANFRFSPDTMTIKKGDTVKVIFSNTDASMPHDWVIDEFDTRTSILQPGESEIIEFVADKAGTFEFYCSVGQHRANGMVGKLIVQ